MESTSMIDGGDGGPTAVAVAVKGGNAGGIGGKGSRRAVRWAVDNLYQKVDRFVLIHVIPNITSIPTPSGKQIPITELDANVVALYIEDVKSQTEELFLPFKKLCKGKKIETLVVEGDNPASGLVGYISESGINNLVLGSCPSNWLTRKLHGVGVPWAVLKLAPRTCNIYIVSRHGLVYDSESSSVYGVSCGISKLWCGSSSKEYNIESSPATSSVTDITRFNSQISNYEKASINSSTVSSSPLRTLGDSILQTRLTNISSMSSTCSNQSNLHAEVEKLRLELQNAVNMYNQACDELVHTQQKVQMITFDTIEGTKRINSTKEREEKYRKIAAEEKQKHLEAVKEIELARNLLEKEVHEREIAEIKAMKESSEKQQIVDALLLSDKRYKRYTIDEMERATESYSESKVIGEGAYGKVYKCNLDHTLVAIKVLSSDTSEKKREFFREVEVLSQLSHPHIVQLLGACPEKGCLIYEYMENGSLEDLISQKKHPKYYLSWNARFRIAFEVACALAFLHNSKPDPIIHRDLKPGNILLDRNLVSKIGDVGMAKLVTEVIPDNITEYRDSVLAGTMYYIDPEYHRTGTVRPKSDLYALGIIILQLLTLLQPKAVISKVESAINCGTLFDILDDSIPDWPLAEVTELIQLGLNCCNLRCRDRPDLDTEVLPVLKKLHEFGDMSRKVGKNRNDAPSHFYCPIVQDIMEDPHIAADGFTYEYRAIKIWLERQNASPVTKRRLQHKTLTPNHTLRSAIQDWRLQSTSSKSLI